MSTGSSSWPSRRLALPGLALALTFLAALPALSAAGAEAVEFELAPAGEEFFAADGQAAPTPAPGPGSCLVIFRYSRLSVADLGQLALIGPDGKALPLLVEPLFEEFGRIADARMVFSLPEAEAAAGRGPFTLKWGPDTKGASSRTERIAADPAHRELYRSLRPRAGAAAGNVASIEVIADSTAEYHFLWYLLPMSMVFALLLARKLLSRGEAGPSRS
ncbi:MAG TPA: hypothetical protein PK280_03455 [Planctomycetota bacterium]|nr:hypothetical protein [Planctomycetota bacterium]